MPSGLVLTRATVLQDPSVSSAPIDQKISFLRSKNLTQEEIDASLARVGQAPAPQSSTPATAQSYPPAQYRHTPPQQYGYQQPPPYWNQPPPEPPRRDWRDWFIMATVVSGAGYAMYWTAKRYVYPLIAPPTPPQIEQDKASIDASFEKTFALLEQLTTDTEELKNSEKTRTERLDHALAEVETVVAKMREANENRETEAKRMAKELEEIKESIPQAIQREKEAMDGRVKDLAVEMKSLKTLVSNRMSGAAQTQNQRPVPGSFNSQSAQTPPTNGINGTSAPATQTNGVSSPPPVDTPSTANLFPKDNEVRPQGSNSPYSSRVLNGKAAIPEWQKRAKERSEEAAKAKKEVEQASQGAGMDTRESGTAVSVEPSGGA